jgi:hypothetical protein
MTILDRRLALLRSLRSSPFAALRQPPALRRRRPSPPRIRVPTRKGRFPFFSKNTGLRNQSAYVAQDGARGEPRALIDPSTLSPDGTVAVTNSKTIAEAADIWTYLFWRLKLAP